MLSGQTSKAPRLDLPLGSCQGSDDGSDPHCSNGKKTLTTCNGMIMWIGKGEDRHLWKYLTGIQILGGWTPQKYPDGGPKPGAFDCNKDGGCLFDLTVDPEERQNLVGQSAHKSQKKQLQQLMQQQTPFSPKRGNQDNGACKQAMKQNGGWWGPWVGDGLAELRNFTAEATAWV